MNNEQQLKRATPSEECSRRQTSPDSRHREGTMDACVAVTIAKSTGRADLPVITDCRWSYFHETTDVIRKAVGEEMDEYNRLNFRCPQCDRRGETKLAGVRDYVTEWVSIGQDWRKCFMTISVFEFKCLSCRLDRNIKICCDRHPKLDKDSPRPRTESYGVQSTEGTYAMTPVIREGDVDVRSAPLRCYPKLESGTNYLRFRCTQCYGWGRYGGIQMVGAIVDPKSPRIREDLFSVTAFRYQFCCRPECQSVMHFDIPVTGQELRMRTYST